MSPLSTTTTAADMAATLDGGGGTPITAIHPDIIQTHILNRLDGSTLASTTCASTQFNSLCTQDNLWKDICNTAWPSTDHHRVAAAISAFPCGHRSFYSDCFPTLHRRGLDHRHSCKQSQQQWLLETPELISAVDIRFAGKLVFSKVLETETISGWFMSSPLRIDLLDLKETVAVPVMFEGEDGNCMEILSENLTVSWILIDPVRNRAVNVASSKAVEARRNWLTEEIQLRYATVMAAAEAEAEEGELVQCGVVISCGGKEGAELYIKEVSMQVEDMEGKILTGMDSLVILLEAMQGQRSKSDTRVEKERFELLQNRRIQFREMKRRKEKNIDIMFITFGVTFLFSLWAYFC